MCCIWTCCGWVVDLIQRFWAFSMSCIISSAVCCALFTAAMAGIALGYNYSLAEYIDIKETNVSVYLKRGVFDDEIANDMEWRRSGNALPPPETKIRGGNVEITAPSPEEIDFRRKMQTQEGRRRLDDSILESDDSNKYEGSLMRLTAGVPAQTTAEVIASADPRVLEIADQYTQESLDHLKALQGLINLRRGNMLPKTTTPIPREPPTIDPNNLRYIPPGILNFLPDTMRRAMQYSDLGMSPNYNSLNINPARKSVPLTMNEARDWRDPKLPQSYFTHDPMGVVDDHPTYPVPMTINQRPLRPTRPRAPQKPRGREPPKQVGRQNEEGLEKSIDSELGKFKEKLLLDKFDMPGAGGLDDDMRERAMKKDDYEDEFRGLPVRKKRDVVNNIDQNKTILIANTKNYSSTPTTLGYFLSSSNNKNVPNSFDQNNTIFTADTDSYPSFPTTMGHVLSSNGNKDKLNSVNQITTILSANSDTYSSFSAIADSVSRTEKKKTNSSRLKNHTNPWIRITNSRTSTTQLNQFNNSSSFINMLKNYKPLQTIDEENTLDANKINDTLLIKLHVNNNEKRKSKVAIKGKTEPNLSTKPIVTYSSDQDIQITDSPYTNGLIKKIKKHKVDLEKIQASKEKEKPKKSAYIFKVLSNIFKYIFSKLWSGDDNSSVNKKIIEQPGKRLIPSKIKISNRILI